MSLLAAPASAGIIRCDGCAESAYQQAAVAAGPGEHVVYDLANDRVVGFSVEYDRESRRPRVSPADVDPEIRAQVTAFSVLFWEVGAALNQTVEVRADDLQLLGLGGASAFDVVEDASLRTRMADRLWQHPPSTLPVSLRNAIDAVRSAPFPIIGGSYRTRINAIFGDGSRVSFMLGFATQDAPYDPGSARTPGGQLIPDSYAPNEAAGIWTFGKGSVGESDDAGRFVEHLRALGIPVTGAGDDTKTIKCIREGGTLACTAT
jgi:hypothetical protein